MKIINPNEYGGLLFDEKEENAVLNVLRHEKIFRYADSKEVSVDRFESKLKKYVNVKYALGVTNGTAGLITALVGCNIKPGDRVLVSSYTFLATALAPKMLEAIPVPLEIDPVYGLNITDFENELKKGCKAVIVVELQGRCYDLARVLELTHKYGAILIEDSCQAFGARYHDKYSGTIADIGVYSFQQFKQITSGEGGAVITNNKEYYDRMRNYTDMGSERNLMPNWNGASALFGQNYRMNNISGAILCEQIDKLDMIIQKQQAAREYILKNINTKRVINSADPEHDTGMNILLSLSSMDEYNKLKAKGEKCGIEIRKMWSGLYFENELFKKNHLTDVDLKNSKCSITKDFIDRLAVISIPPTLSKKDCDAIINFINANC